MKQAELAKWLKGIVLFTGLIGIVFLAFFVPPLLRELASDNTELEYLVAPGLFFFWATALPVYLSLYKVWQICCEIAHNNSFCHGNAMLLRDISRLCILDCVLYLIAGCLLLLFGHFDVLVLVLLFGAILLGIFLAAAAAALSHLTDKASQLKHENDLTI